MLHSSYTFAVNLTVNSTADTDGSATTGTLRQVINYLNASGTATTGKPVTDNTITINAGVGNISLTSDLPQIGNSVSITSNAGGGTTITGNNNRAFATFQSSLSLDSITISGARATGGSGASGGGGGLGAGGGIYVDINTTMTITDTAITGCQARGGAGSVGSASLSASGGGGGGGSFSFSQNASGQVGGGALGGSGGSSNSTGGTGGAARNATTPATTYTGYGGGVGGNTTAAGGGNNAGGNGVITTPGVGGYCGGSGGSGRGTGGGGQASGGGGGGGNGGGNGGAGRFGGAGGPGPGGGGGGGMSCGGGGGGGANNGNYSSGGGGGGGGFGAGGGAGGNIQAFTAVAGGGGGGGGFGGGGGGGGRAGGGGGSGGSYGGDGGDNNAGGGQAQGGGGAAIGGAIFVGDSSSLVINQGSSLTANTVIGGAAGGAAATAGSTLAPDIFLFRNASVTFSPNANLAVPYSIQIDTAAPTGHTDQGVTIAATASTVTFSSTSNNYVGGTNITSGTLSAGIANLPAATVVTVGASGGFLLTGGGTYVNPITNAGVFTINGATTFSSTITNTGTMNVDSAIAINGTLTNSGTIDIAAAFSGTGTLTNASGSTMNINTGGTFTAPTTFTTNGTTTLNGTGNIIGAFAGSTGSTLNIGSLGAASYTSSGNISGITTLTTETAGTVFTVGSGFSVTGNTGSSFDVAAGTTVNLSNGSNVSGFNSINIDGIYNILAGGTYTLSASHNLTGSGTLSNSGQFFVDSSNVSFSGSFSNNATGNFSISGTPTITFSGTTFTNEGNLISSFSASNSLPFINLPNVVVPANLDLSNGIITVSYNNNYVASKDYLLLTAGTVPVTGVTILPQNTRYISDWSLASVGNSLFVRVERNGFGEHALTEPAKNVGDYLELLGEGTPTQAQLDLLNSLEKIDNDAELTDALLSLLPAQYTLVVTTQMLDSVVGNIDIRMASINNGYISGDSSETNHFWVRPFTTSAKQRARGTLEAYTDSSNGWVIGVDKIIDDTFTLGMGGSYTKTYIESTESPSTNTNVKSYMATFYATKEYKGNTYFDSVLVGGVSNYDAARVIILPSYEQGTSASYSSQQITIKGMVSKNLTYDFWQLTPKGMMQYVFIHQPIFTENGAGDFDNEVDANNVNLFRLGAGFDLGVPFTTRNLLSIPSIYFMAYYDAKGGQVDVNTSFVGGGPVIGATVQAAKLLYKLGFKYELKVSDKVEFVANYDLLRRQGYTGQEAYLNFKYRF